MMANDEVASNDRCISLWKRYVCNVDEIYSDTNHRQRRRLFGDDERLTILLLDLKNKYVKNWWLTDRNKKKGKKTAFKCWLLFFFSLFLALSSFFLFNNKSFVLLGVLFLYSNKKNNKFILNKYSSFSYMIRKLSCIKARTSKFLLLSGIFLLIYSHFILNTDIYIYKYIE